MAGLLLWIGQSLAVAALAAAVGRLGAHRLRPAVQHVVWSSALACIAALSIAGLTFDAGAAGSAVGFAPASAGRAAALGPLVVPPVPAWVAQTFLLIWVAGAIWQCARLGWQACRVSGLKRSCVVMAGRNLRTCARLAGEARHGRRARFCWSDEVAGPAMLGFGTPVIAMPQGQADRLGAGEFEQVLLHELAHVRRLDDWSALAERLVAAILWINPAVAWVRRGLSVAREMACDDWVIRRTAAPSAYARCLTRVAALRVHQTDDRLVATAVGSRRALTRRVARVIDERTRPSARFSQVAFALVPVMTGVLGAAMLAMPPLVVDDVAVDARPGGDAPMAATDRLEPAGESSAQPLVAKTAAVEPGVPRPTPRPDRATPTIVPAGREPAKGVVFGRGARSAPARTNDAAQRVVAQSGTAAADPDPALLPPPTARSSGDLLMSPGAQPSSPLLIAGSSRPTWWSKASGAVGTLGGGAASAGRTTASFLKRVSGTLLTPFGP